ncbi:MAG TPA: hypothetical protein VHK00_02350 [Miltoncostaeaceae bacterium]|nr:hypothetical protein [Miltoncostaeaceae bacterium]
MPLQNRVTPFSEIVAVPQRGALMGNRGVLHDDRRRIVRFSQGRRWIACLTEFRGRRRAPMTPGRYTELFFLDEATALAAGHRPCHECRRAAALRFREAWARATGEDPRVSLELLDRRLHEDRLEAPGRMRRWSAEAGALPDGAMVEVGGAAHLVRQGRIAMWTPAGYGPAGVAPAGPVRVLTPRAIVATIAAGYRPEPTTWAWAGAPPALHGADASARVTSRFSAAATIAISTTMTSTRVPTSDVSAAGKPT